MKTPFISPFRKYSTAAFAALSLVTLPLVSQAKDKDDDDHPKGKKKDEHVEKKHEERPEKKHEAKVEKHDESPRTMHKEKDDVVIHHKDVPHKGDPVVHEEKVHSDRVVHHDGPDHVVRHEGPDHVVRHDDKVIRRDDRVVHHRHPGYVLHLADGWRGRGYYYGPPGLRYYDESPDVVYFTTREEVPTDYVSDAPESRDAAVQRALTEKGYYNGAVDGELGPMSHRAIAKYQADHDMRPTGEVTERLLISLGIN